MASYLAAPVRNGSARWGESLPVVETPDLWRRRAALWRCQRDAARAQPPPAPPTPPQPPPPPPPPDRALRAEVDRLRAATGRLEERHRQAALALQHLLRHSTIPHDAIERVRGYLAGERRTL